MQLLAGGQFAGLLMPVEITSGDLFRVEVDGELKLTRMEYDDSYYSLRPAIHFRRKE
jgi:hypothetical protein